MHLSCFFGFHDWQVQRTTNHYGWADLHQLRLTSEETNALLSKGLRDEMDWESDKLGILLKQPAKDQICRQCEKIVLQVDDAIQTWILQTQAKLQAEAKLQKADAERAERLTKYKYLKNLAK